MREKICGTPQPQQPPADQFAEMLASLFRGTSTTPERPRELTEKPFSLEELKGAVKKMRANRAADEGGLVAELPHHAPRDLL